jgi:hypothetical protein
VLGPGFHSQQGGRERERNTHTHTEREREREREREKKNTEKHRETEREKKRKWVQINTVAFPIPPQCSLQGIIPPRKLSLTLII